MKRSHLAWLIPCALLLAAGCATVGKVTEAGARAAGSVGLIDPNQAESIARTASAAGKAFEQITPEQEYFIGRAVAASILTTYNPYSEAAANRYVNLVGQTLALASSKPETFGGYHFLIMNTEEINAFAAPGGLILISRGLLRCCRTEDALAAVLAHEIGHVQHGHGLQAIKKSRLTSALTILAAESAKTLGGEDLAQLTQAFEGSISDITQTLVNSGYSRKFESEADRAAIAIMTQVGYNPRGLVDMLQQMNVLMPDDDQGFGKTHPDPADRIADIEALVAPAPPLQPPAARQARFDKALSGI